MNGKVVSLLAWQHFSNLQKLGASTAAKSQRVTYTELLHWLGRIEVSVIWGDHCPVLFFGVDAPQLP